MAHLDSISVGNYTGLRQFSVDSWLIVNEIQSISAPTDEATLVPVQEYNVEYQRNLVGSKTVGAIDLVLNFNPENGSHNSLIDKYVTGESTQYALVYTNADDSKSTYQRFTGIIASKSLSSEFDQVRTLTLRIAITDGLSDYEEILPTIEEMEAEEIVKLGEVPSNLNFA